MEMVWYDSGIEKGLVRVSYGMAEVWLSMVRVWASYGRGKVGVWYGRLMEGLEYGVVGVRKW